MKKEDEYFRKAAGGSLFLHLFVIGIVLFGKFSFKHGNDIVMDVEIAGEGVLDDNPQESNKELGDSSLGDASSDIPPMMESTLPQNPEAEQHPEVEKEPEPVEEVPQEQQPEPVPVEEVPQEQPSEPVENPNPEEVTPNFDEELRRKQEEEAQKQAELEKQKELELQKQEEERLRQKKLEEEERLRQKKLEEEKKRKEEARKKKEKELKEKKKRRKKLAELLKKSKKKAEEKKKREALSKLLKKKNRPNPGNDLMQTLSDLEKTQKTISRRKRTGSGTGRKGIGSGSAGTGLGADGSSADIISSQIYPHWIIPAGIKNSENLNVELHIEVNDNGEVIPSSVKVIDVKRYSTDEVFRMVADSAIQAVLSASPLKIPADMIEMFKSCRVRFNVKEALGE